MTVAGVYNQSYPGTGQAFKVGPRMVGVCVSCQLHSPPKSTHLLAQAPSALHVTTSLIYTQTGAEGLQLPRDKTTMTQSYQPVSSPALLCQPPCCPRVLSAQAMNCKGVYFEDSDVWGSAPGGWSLTYIAVQYGHICRSKVHHADWCFGLSGACRGV